ncbi:MAG: hypothetical protein M1832_002781 [Thelocarpon impressellum]|nr:MAG: hypothetical protein M1832_002781 [Thelocarpon impressellum]
MEGHDDSLDSVALRTLQRNVLGIEIDGNGHAQVSAVAYSRALGTSAGGEDITSRDLRSPEIIPPHLAQERTTSRGRRPSDSPVKPDKRGSSPRKSSPSQPPSDDNRVTRRLSSSDKKMSSSSTRFGTGSSEHDTQPMPEYVYDDYLKRYVRSQERRDKLAGAAHGNVSISEAMNVTYREDDTGHIELCDGLGHDMMQHGPNRRYPEKEYETSDNISSPHLNGDVYPESRRFQPPETPVARGTKRHRNGEAVEPATTPRLPANPFVRAGPPPGGMMQLSQVFNNTQAVSSPFRNGLTSDPLSERPSPDMFNVRRSVPAGTSSSPLQQAAAPIHRNGLEPISKYVTLAESQEARERALRLQKSSVVKVRLRNSSSDDELDPEESERVRRKLRLEKIELDTRRQFNLVSAPRTTLDGGNREGRDSSGLLSGVQVTPIRQALSSHLRPSEPNGISGHTNVGEDVEAELEEDTEGETIIDASSMRVAAEEEGYPDAPYPGHSDGLQVPMTTGRPAPDRNEPDVRTIAATPGSPSESRRKRARIQNAGEDLSQATPYHEDGGIEGMTEEEETLVVTGTQTEAVIDSQPSAPPGMVITRRATAAAPGSMPASLEPLVESPSQSPCPREAGQDAKESSSLPQPPGTSEGASNSSTPRSQAGKHNSAMLPKQRRGSSQRSRSGLSQEATHGDYAAWRDSRPPPNGHNYPANANISVVADNGEPADGQFGHGPALGVQPNGKYSFGGSHSAKGASNRPSGANSSERADQRQRADVPFDSDTRIPESSPAGLSGPKLRLAGPPQIETRMIPGSSQGATHESNAVATSTEDPRPELSNVTNGFETAQTHIEGSTTRSWPEEEASRPPSLRQAHRLENPRIRTLTEIAADPSPPDVTEDIDMDFRLITSQDVEFQVAIDGSSPLGPAKKRRRGRGGRVLQESDERHNQAVAVPKPPSQREAENVRLPLAAKRPSSTMQEKVKQGLPSPVKKAKIVKPIKKTYASRSKIPAWSKTTASEAPDMGTSRASEISVPEKDMTGFKTTKSRLRAAPANLQDSREALDVAGQIDRSVRGKLENPSTEICVPDRVFAHFRGGNSAYYPATCLGVLGTDQPRFKVRFDDGTADVVAGHEIRRLDLRIGDVVKVDLAQMRTKNYVVTGLQDKQVAPGADGWSELQRGGRSKQSPLTDIRGYATALLKPKQKDGVSANGLLNVEPVQVPMTNVYVVQSNWVHFHSRVYKHVAGIETSTRPQTPIAAVSTPSTPSTRGRRATPALMAKTQMNGASRPSFGIFGNMVFAVSYVGKDTEKSRVIKLILENGGRVLSDGFEQLFTMDGPGTSEGGSAASLRLTREAAKLGFACLIADQHSRRAKYMQALALGLPCLAGRWIEDSVGAGKVLEWESYLLPSGDSSFLRGAVRSRVLQPYDAASAQFSSTIGARPKLLAGRAVMLVVGKGKVEERRRAYLFLTYALGASRVGKVPNIDAAKKALEAGGVDAGWDWVYVDGAEAGAREALGGAPGPSAGKSKKRKRASGEGAGQGRKVVKVVGDEFVVQSLILGRLLEED